MHINSQICVSLHKHNHFIIFKKQQFETRFLAPKTPLLCIWTAKKHKWFSVFSWNRCHVNGWDDFNIAWKQKLINSAFASKVMFTRLTQSVHFTIFIVVQKQYG